MKKSHVSLHRSDKPVLLVINKVDNALRVPNTVDFFALGIEKTFHVSAINGSGTGELLDTIIHVLPKTKEPESLDLPRFAVVGRPNAGKSSFINALLGKERNIVTDQAGTTRDSIDTIYNQYGFEFVLVDTVESEKSKVKEDIEFYSVMRALRSIEHSDVCLVLFDATRSFDSQVKNIFWLAARNHKGIEFWSTNGIWLKKIPKQPNYLLKQYKKKLLHLWMFQLFLFRVLPNKEYLKP